jgi:hypothetical protein
MTLEDPGIFGWIFLAIWIVLFIFVGLPYFFRRAPKVEMEKLLGKTEMFEVCIATDGKTRWIDLAIWIPGRGAGLVQINAHLAPRQAKLLAQWLRRAAG